MQYVSSYIFFHMAMSYARMLQLSCIPQANITNRPIENNYIEIQFHVYNRQFC